MKNMKKILGLSALALIAIFPLVSNSPADASFGQAEVLISQNVQSPEVKLNLTMAKRNITKDEQGKEVVTWENMANNSPVRPGDFLRYTVTGENVGSSEAKNLVVTQPIPRSTIYVMDSALSNGAEITYSIDGGRNFSKKPMVLVKLPNGKQELQPAPAEKYTHVRWKFVNSIPLKSSVKAYYQVRVL